MNGYLLPVDYYSTVLNHLAINIMEIRRQQDFRFKHSSTYCNRKAKVRLAPLNQGLGFDMRGMK